MFTKRNNRLFDTIVTTNILSYLDRIDSVNFKKVCKRFRAAYKLLLNGSTDDNTEIYDLEIHERWKSIGMPFHTIKLVGQGPSFLIFRDYTINADLPDCSSLITLQYLKFEFKYLI